MIDFARIVGFDWDQGNLTKSADKHGVVVAESEEVFFNQPLLVVDDPAHSRLEIRLHALGVTNVGRRLHVSFTLRAEDTLIRIISARDMSERERRRYEQEA
jgi:uncharacterized DUF497 family protein